jgi:N,N-dimethylformamidase
MVADGWDRGAGYRRTDAARDPRVAFAFEDVHGDVLGAPCGAHPGASGQEVDAADPELGTPDHALVVASSTMLGAGYYLAPEEVVFLHSATTGDVNARVRADLIFFETRAGGAVFSTGSIAWGAAMAAEQGRTDVGRLTENIIRRFADPEPFALPSSVPAGDV